MGELGYIDALLGHWDVRYPGADGMIVDGYVEALELKIDGTFSWNPTPLWAKPGGRWGIEFVGAEQMKLYIEERRGGYRANWLVFGAMPEPMWCWQRTRTDGVVFDDRVLMARRNTSCRPAPTPVPAAGSAECAPPSDYPISLIESLSGILGPAAWGTGAPIWRTSLGTLAASPIEVDMPLPGHRITALLALSLTLTSSGDTADLVAKLHAPPGLGAAFASLDATKVEVASQLPLSADDTPKDRERLGSLLATAGVAQLHLAAACLRLPAPASLLHREAAWGRELTDLGSELARGGEGVRMNASALCVGGRATGVRFLGTCTHPCLGNGLLDGISIDVDAGVERATQLAGALNVLHRVAPLPLLGAWTAPPEGCRICYASFFPNIAHETGLLAQIATWQRERLHFAQYMLQRLAKRPAD